MGAPAIQQLRRASHAYDYRIFYSSSEYTSAALAADESGVALFAFTETNHIAAANQIASKLLATIERELQARETLKDEDQWSRVQTINSRRIALWRSLWRRAIDGTFVCGPRLQMTDTRIAYLAHGLSLLDLDAVMSGTSLRSGRLSWSDSS